MIKTDNWS